MASVNGSGGASVEPVNTTYPSSSAPRTYSISGFRVSTQKLPILKAGPIEAMTEKLGIAPPEMIFGDNYVSIEHEASKSKWGIVFNAFGALDLVDKTGEKRLKVSYSKEWHASREGEHDITEVIKPFDWSYTTDYAGELAPGSKEWEPAAADQQIPVELLRRPDPILFFDDVMLYEDELADNGIAMLSVKIRVMPKRLLLLQRFFMRLDNVVLRLRDTRVYIDFDEKEVLREYLEKEDEYDKVKRRLAGREDVSSVMRDPNQIAAILPEVKRVMERVDLKT
ncbi:hypothetical protein DV735_g3075, partial [Chaetothyriales sp. CBS 134920]